MRFLGFLCVFGFTLLALAENNSPASGDSTVTAPNEDHENLSIESEVGDTRVQYFWQPRQHRGAISLQGQSTSSTYNTLAKDGNTAGSALSNTLTGTVTFSFGLSKFWALSIPLPSYATSHTAKFPEAGGEVDSKSQGPMDPTVTLMQAREYSNWNLYYGATFVLDSDHAVNSLAATATASGVVGNKSQGGSSFAPYIGATSDPKVPGVFGFKLSETIFAQRSQIGDDTGLQASDSTTLINGGNQTILYLLYENRQPQFYGRLVYSITRTAGEDNQNTNADGIARIETQANYSYGGTGTLGLFLTKDSTLSFSGTLTSSPGTSSQTKSYPTTATVVFKVEI